MKVIYAVIAGASLAFSTGNIWLCPATVAALASIDTIINGNE